MSAAFWSPQPPYACEPTSRPLQPLPPTQRDCDAFDGSYAYRPGREEWQYTTQVRAWTRETWPSLPPPPREAAYNVVLPRAFSPPCYPYADSDDFVSSTYPSPPFPPYPPSRSFPPPPPPHPSTAYYPSSSATAASNPPISRLPRFLPRPPVRAPPVHPQDVETPTSFSYSSERSSSTSSASSFSSSDTSSTNPTSGPKRLREEMAQEEHDDDDDEETANLYSRPFPPWRTAVFAGARQLRLACASLTVTRKAEEDQEQRRKRSKLEERKREAKRRLDKLKKEEKTEVETFPIPTAPHSSFSFYVASLPPPPSSLPLKPSFPCVLPGEALPPETMPTEVDHAPEEQEERDMTERRTAREAQRLRGRLVRERWESVACTALERKV